MCNVFLKYQHVCISTENTVGAHVPRLLSLPQGIILGMLGLNYAMPAAINNTESLTSDLYICF